MAIVLKGGLGPELGLALGRVDKHGMRCATGWALVAKRNRRK